MPQSRSRPVEFKIRNAVFSLRTPHSDLPISGLSVATTRADGTEDEAVFSSEFTVQEVVRSVLNANGHTLPHEAKEKLAEVIRYVKLDSGELELSSPPTLKLKIQKLPEKTVTFYVK